MRSLYIIPIVHTAADLGRLEFRLESLKTSVIPRERIDASRRAVQFFWQELRTAIESWQLEFDKVNIYQDALPFSPIAEMGIEHKIVCDLAAIGSPNHVLLKWLIERGAKLLGTESPQLLIAEYTLVKRSLDSSPVDRAVKPNAITDVSNGRAQEPASDGSANDSVAVTEINSDLEAIDIQRELSDLLRERDQFIASRIDSTLLDGHKGIIFLGMLHDLEKWLPDDIQVEYPIGKPNASSNHAIHNLSV